MRIEKILEANQIFDTCRYHFVILKNCKENKYKEDLLSLITKYINNIIIDSINNEFYQLMDYDEMANFYNLNHLIKIRDMLYYLHSNEYDLTFKDMNYLNKNDLNNAICKINDYEKETFNFSLNLDLVYNSKNGYIDLFEPFFSFILYRSNIDKSVIYNNEYFKYQYGNFRNLTFLNLCKYLCYLVSNDDESIFYTKEDMNLSTSSLPYYDSIDSLIEVNISKKGNIHKYVYKYLGSGFIIDINYINHDIKLTIIRDTNKTTLKIIKSLEIENLNDEIYKYKDEISNSYWDLIERIFNSRDNEFKNHIPYGEKIFEKIKRKFIRKSTNEENYVTSKSFTIDIPNTDNYIIVNTEYIDEVDYICRNILLFKKDRNINNPLIFSYEYGCKKLAIFNLEKGYISKQLYINDDSNYEEEFEEGEEINYINLCDIQHFLTEEIINSLLYILYKE